MADNDIPVPVTMVATIAMIPYLEVVKIVEAIAESVAPEDPWLNYLGDEHGAVTPSVASAVIVSTQMERASAGDNAPEPQGGDSLATEHADQTSN